MTDRELLRQALDALEDVLDDAEEPHKTKDAIQAIRTRLAQPKKEWIGLTVIKDAGESSLQLVFQTREQADNAKAKLKEKNK